VNGRIKVGERVVVPFTIICGECEQCRRGTPCRVPPRLGTDVQTLTRSMRLDLHEIDPAMARV
jgi:threonine dehydrogenase-like Zn-dependent dehydrogenase